MQEDHANAVCAEPPLEAPLLATTAGGQIEGQGSLVPHAASAQDDSPSSGTGSEAGGSSRGWSAEYSTFSNPVSGRGSTGRPRTTDASTVGASAASEPRSLAHSSPACAPGSTLAVLPTREAQGNASAPRSGSKAKGKTASVRKLPLEVRSARSTLDSDSGSETSGGGGRRSGTKRTVGVLGLALLAYLTVCAGPYGIEDAVAAAGPGPVLLGVILLGLLWGLPQSLITAELSCMMDVNGSYVLWVERGLGPTAAWISSFNSALSNACDTPLYCILLSTYVNSLVASMTGSALPHWAQLALRGATLAIMLSANLRGMETVQGGALLVVLAMLLPFLLEPIVGWHYLQPAEWVATRPLQDVEWAVLTSTLLWNFQGWDAMGAIAGEVKHASRTYVWGIALALLLTVVTYLIPVATNAGVNSNFTAWGDGSLAGMASQVAPWLGVWVVVGACLAQLGNGLTMLANSSRVLWQMAHRRMLPPVLGCTWEAYGTPATALLAQALVTAVLMVVSDFPTLVVFDTFFNNISLTLETVAFLRLRYIEANTHRPFLVPGGLPLAWALTVAKGAVLGFAFATITAWHVWAIAGGVNVVVILGYFAVSHCRRSDLQASAGRLGPGEEAALLLSEV